MEEPFLPENNGEPLLPEEKSAKKSSRWKTVLTELLKALAFLTCGALLALLLVPNSLIPSSSFNSAEQKLALLNKMIRTYYLYGDQIDEDDLEDGLALGYLYGLGDPYSEYLTAEEFSDIQFANNGGESGIGILVTYSEQDNGICVVKVVPDSPAEKAGLQKADLIVSVDGSTVTADNYGSCIASVRGDLGTTVSLGVVRNGNALTVAVERNEYAACNVYARVVDNIGVIEITAFTAVTAKQFKTAVADLQAQGVKALVFDVRDNSGGLVDAAGEMLDYLLPKGELAYAVYQGGKRRTLVSSDASCVDLPMAVMVNDASASAAELFASALRDSGNVPLIGETTFGKGIMQTTYPLGDGSAVRLTVAKFYTASGTEFHGTGLKPDVEVSLPEGTNRYLLDDADEAVLQAALLAVSKQSE